MILIDAMMLIRRCHAKMDFLKNSSGVSTGMEFGVLRTVEMLQKKYDGEVIFCFDSPGSDRRRADSGYKSNRKPMPAEFYERVSKFEDFLINFYGVSKKLGREADDVMYSLSQLCLGPHYVYTNDDDLLQAVSDKQQVKVIKSFQSKLYEWDEAKVKEKYGVRPSLLPVYRAFVGDKSDNLPGISRFNKKYLATLIEWCADNEIDFITDEILSADWKPKELDNIVAFINSGAFDRNLELMKLVVEKVEIAGPRLDESHALETLKKWEIRTLKICEPFKDELNMIDEEKEEF